MPMVDFTLEELTKCLLECSQDYKCLTFLLQEADKQCIYTKLSQELPAGPVPDPSNSLSKKTYTDCITSTTCIGVHIDLSSHAYGITNPEQMEYILTQNTNMSSILFKGEFLDTIDQFTFATINVSCPVVQSLHGIDLKDCFMICVVGKYSGISYENQTRTCDIMDCLDSTQPSADMMYFSPVLVNKDECSSSPCQNGGVCQDHINRLECTCPSSRYIGRFCETDINISFGKDAWIKDERNAAGNAVDGSTNSNFQNCAAANGEMANHIWGVDLGDDYDIWNVTITNRGDCCPQRLKDVEVIVSGKGFPMDPLIDTNYVTCASHPGSLGGTTVLNCGADTWGRYLYVWLTTSTEFSICEVEVFGILH